MAQATTTAKFATTHTEDTRLYVLAFAIVVAAEFIGIVNFSVGPGKIVLLPMLWALLIGGVWSMAESWLPGPLQIGTALQRRASAIVQLAVLLFAAKLGLLVGGSLPKLATAGWALLFQEFGHYSGNRIIPATEPAGVFSGECRTRRHILGGIIRGVVKRPKTQSLGVANESICGESG